MAIEPGRVGGFAEERCVGILPVRHPIIRVVQGFVCGGDFVGGKDTRDDEMADEVPIVAFTAGHSHPWMKVSDCAFNDCR